MISSDDGMLMDENDEQFQKPAPPKFERFGSDRRLKRVLMTTTSRAKVFGALVARQRIADWGLIPRRSSPLARVRLPERVTLDLLGVHAGLLRNLLRTSIWVEVDEMRFLER
jgi:hypothetical protein